MDRTNAAYVAFRTHHWINLAQLLLGHNSAARLRGFEEDLGMTGNQFNTLMSIFYVGYLLTQTPSYVPARYPFCGPSENSKATCS